MFIFRVPFILFSFLLMAFFNYNRVELGCYLLVNELSTNVMESRMEGDSFQKTYNLHTPYKKGIEKEMYIHITKKAYSRTLPAVFGVNEKAAFSKEMRKDCIDLSK